MENTTNNTQRNSLLPITLCKHETGNGKDEWATKTSIKETSKIKKIF